MAAKQEGSDAGGGICYGLRTKCNEVSSGTGRPFFGGSEGYSVDTLFAHGSREVFGDDISNPLITVGTIGGCDGNDFSCKSRIKH